MLINSLKQNDLYSVTNMRFWFTSLPRSFRLGQVKLSFATR